MLTYASRLSIPTIGDDLSIAEMSVRWNEKQESLLDEVVEDRSSYELTFIMNVEFRADAFVVACRGVVGDVQFFSDFFQPKSFHNES